MILQLSLGPYVARIEYPDDTTAEVFQGKTDKTGIEKLIDRLRPTDRVGMECCAYAFHLAKELIRKVGCEVFVLKPGSW